MCLDAYACTIELVNSQKKNIETENSLDFGFFSISCDPFILLFSKITHTLGGEEERASLHFKLALICLLINE